MSYTYASFVTSYANLLVVPETDPNFQTMLSNSIDDSEQRLYRDLDLLNTVVNGTTTLTTGQRSFNLPTTNGTFLVVNQIYAITPGGTTVPDNGTRNPLLPTSRDYLDATYPSSNGSALPVYFAPTTQSTFIVAPWPDQAYTIEVSGTVRPTPLSSTNVTTLLTVYFPDLWMTANMIFGAAYQQNFGQAVDNPQQGVTWEQHYTKLIQSAQTEEARKKFTAEGWSSKQPSPLATPPRT